MSNLPCEECISLAICYNRHNIKCEDLYRFVNVTIVTGGGQETFARRRRQRNVIIHEVFGRCVTGTNINTYSVVLSRINKLGDLCGEDCDLCKIQSMSV